MTIYTRWFDDQQTILYTNYGEVWTWTDIHKHGKTVIHPLLQKRTQPVAKIADLSETVWQTTGLFIDNFKQGINAYRDAPVDVTIFIIHNESVRTAMETITYQHGAPHRLYAFPQTIADAINIIHNHRHSSMASV